MVNKKNVSLLGLIFGIIVFLCIYFSPPPQGLDRIAWVTAGIAILMTIWWVTEAIPIYATGLVPLLLFPLFGLFELKTVSASYAHPLVLLFLGGFIGLWVQWGLIDITKAQLSKRGIIKDV